MPSERNTAPTDNRTRMTAAGAFVFSIDLRTLTGLNLGRALAQFRFPRNLRPTRHTHESRRTVFRQVQPLLTRRPTFLLSQHIAIPAHFPMFLRPEDDHAAKWTQGRPPFSKEGWNATNAFAPHERIAMTSFMGRKFSTSGWDPSSWLCCQMALIPLGSTRVSTYRLQPVP